MNQSQLRDFNATLSHNFKEKLQLIHSTTDHPLHVIKNLVGPTCFYDIETKNIHTRSICFKDGEFIPGIQIINEGQGLTVDFTKCHPNDLLALLYWHNHMFFQLNQASTIENDTFLTSLYTANCLAIGQKAYQVYKQEVLNAMEKIKSTTL